MRTTDRAEGRQDAQSPADTVDGDGEDEELDIEAALLAMTEDMGGPVTEVDLSTLSPAEKRAVLHCLRQRLGISESSPAE